MKGSQNILAIIAMARIGGSRRMGHGYAPDVTQTPKKLAEKMTGGA
jgi:hypothetical protein